MTNQQPNAVEVANALSNMDISLNAVKPLEPAVSKDKAKQQAIDDGLKTQLDNAPQQSFAKPLVQEDKVVGMDASDLFKGISTPATPTQEPTPAPVVDEPKPLDPVQPTQEPTPNIDEPKLEVDVEKLTSKEDEPKAKVSNYGEVFKKLSEVGLINSVNEVELEDGTTIPIEEYDFSEEDFIVALVDQVDTKIKSSLDNKIDAEGISEFTQKLIEIERNGGNVQEAIQFWNQNQLPLENIDINDLQVQFDLVVRQLIESGTDEAIAVHVAESLRKENKLEDQAHKIYTKKLEQNKATLDAAAEEQKRRHQELIDSQKQLKKALNDEMSNTFQLSDNRRRELVKLATNVDAHGITPLDNLYFEVRQDPKKLTEMTLFLTDKDAYLEQLTNEKVRQNQLKVMKTISLKSGSKTSTTSKTQQTPKQSTSNSIKPLEPNTVNKIKRFN